MSIKNKIIVVTSIILIVFIVVIWHRVSGNLVPQKIKNKKSIEQRLEESKDYQYANSTDIYSMDGRFDLNGENKRELPFFLKKENISIAYVNDDWLYFYEDYEEGETGKLKRIPLHKGDDHRDVVNGSKAEVVCDTYAQNEFLVNDDFYAGISYGTSAILLDMKNGKTIRKAVPESIQYPKKVEMEEKIWEVLEKSKDWILWRGDYGTMIQHVPTGEVTVLEKKSIEMATKSRNCLYYSINTKNWYQYDFANQQKIKIFGEQDIKKVINNYFHLNNTKQFKDYIIERAICNSDKIYFQIVFKKSKERKRRQYVMVKYDIDEKSLKVDKEIQDLLERYKNIMVLGEIYSNWYLYDGNYWCYNNRKLKKIYIHSPEWNRCYGKSQLGLGTW